ncbi:TolC family protein [Aequorivita sp. H23M31]|uniref:TolC family protein n=1 Tax=Aequorivita ciconiae TaxID=2494375 RepID=A0A410G494_9FLAO|nr:TolC family protein [Aequorivita sp. H23M31]QAA82035.1 TolC family protein [Aequorivita sp. H23M31]
MKTFQKLNMGLALLFGVLIAPFASGQQMQERKMTVQELAQSIEANNIQLKLAKASVDIADAKIGAVKTNRLPDIGADMQVFYLSDVSIFDKRFHKIQEVDIHNFGHQFNVSANQLIFAGGKINKSIQLAEMNKTLSENNMEDTDQGVKLNAAELYLNLYNLQNQKRILESNKTLATERTKNAQYYYEEDMITKNELLRAEVLERQLEQAILQVQNAILITNKNLTLFAGLDENVLIVPDISNLDHQIRQEDEVFFREIAFQNNPKLQASDTQIAIAEKNLELTRTDRLPILAGFAGYNASRPQTAGSPMDVYSNTYQVGLNLSYNLESLFKNPKKEAVDKIVIDQAELAKEATRQQIEGEVNAAFKNYHQALEQREVSAINEEAAAENYRITELKYKNQLVTYLEIIDASNIKLQAELQTLDDQTDIILNYVKLLRVTGQL